MAMKGYSTFHKAPATGTSPLDCLVSYAGHSLRGANPSADVQYFTAPVGNMIDLSAIRTLEINAPEL